MHSVATVFTEQAESSLSGETGLIKFDWFTYPNVGDSVTLKTSPNGKVLLFVCKSRHFDFSLVEEPVLTITLDLPQ